MKEIHRGLKHHESDLAVHSVVYILGAVRHGELVLGSATWPEWAFVGDLISRSIGQFILWDLRHISGDIWHP